MIYKNRNLLKKFFKSDSGKELVEKCPTLRAIKNTNDLILNLERDQNIKKD